MRDIAASATASVDVDPKRDEALRSLAESIATRPLDLSKVATARDEVVSMLGRGVLVEAAGVAGTFEMMTKLTTSTGKLVSPHKTLMRLFVHCAACVFAFLKWIGLR